MRVYVFGGYRLEPARRSLARLDGVPLDLSGKPFDALVYLVEHAGEIVDRGALLKAVWPRRVVEDNNVNQAISVLRHVLGAHHIATVAGRGYQFVTPVHLLDAERGDRAATTLNSEDEESFAKSAKDAKKKLNADLRANARANVLLRPRTLGFLAVLIAATAVGVATVADSRRATLAGPALGALVAVSPVTTYPGEEHGPALSPDGTRVAFSRNDGDQQSIYIAKLDGSDARQLTSSGDAANQDPAWSPDGQRIAFVRQHGAAQFDVVVAAAVGGAEITLYSGERRWISREGFPLLAWTPDNRELWFTTRAGTGASHAYALHRLHIDTGRVEAIELGGTSDDYDTSPAISADGARLAFVRYRTSERLNQVMIQPLGPGYVPTGEAYVVASGGIHHSLAWTPTGNRLWFARGGQILEWRAGSPVRVAATTGPQLSFDEIAFTSRGATVRAVAVSRRSDVDIFALPLDSRTHAATGKPEPRVRSTAVDYHPRFSPNGEQFAFVSNRSGKMALWLADRSGDQLRQLTSLDEFVTGFPRWSPDGASIAFHTSAVNEARVLRSVAASGGPVGRIANACCPGGWSADGRSIYAHSGESPMRVVRVNVADGQSEPLFAGENAVESADAQYLLYAKPRERGYFRRLLRGVPAENPEEKLVGDYISPGGGLAPVADGFYYVGFTPDDRPRAIRFFDYALREARDVWPVPRNVAIGLSVSSDGRELLYAADGNEPNADLMLLDFGAPPAG